MLLLLPPGLVLLVPGTGSLDTELCLFPDDNPVETWKTLELLLLLLLLLLAVTLLKSLLRTLFGGSASFTPIDLLIIAPVTSRMNLSEKGRVR